MNNYLYSVSNIKVAETKMLKYSDFLNLAASKSYNDAIDYLIRTGYFKESDKNLELDKILGLKEKELIDRTKKLDISEINLFLLQNDFHNLKARLKCEFLNVQPEYYLTDFSENTHLYSETYDRCLKVLNETKDLKSAENYIDKEFYQTGINNSKSDFFKNWFKLLKNIHGSDVSHENKKMEYLKKHKYDSFTVAPLFGYFYGTMIELRNVRTVLMGKKINADKSEIIERLCITYA